MKPHVICHMVSSVDGRTLQSRWRPQGLDSGTLFEDVHARLGGGSWMVGRVTGSEFAKREGGYPAPAAGTGDPAAREAWLPRRDAGAYGVVLDAHGKIAWGRSDVGGDPIVVVLSEQATDAHLAGLRGDGVGYVFAGAREIDLAATLETLNRELGIERLLMEGGGGANGAMLRAGLIDEVSLVVCPALDGAAGAPSVFDSGAKIDGASAPLKAMALVSSEVLEGGAVWLRYRLENG